MPFFSPQPKISQLSKPALARNAFLAPGERRHKANDGQHKQADSPSAGHHHNFSRIPIFAPSSIRIQPKLKVNKPGDEYEREADRVAEQVMRMQDVAVGNAAPGLLGVQRKCAACESGGAPCPKCAEEEEKGLVQTKAQGTGGAAVSPALASQIQHSRGGGQALDTGARSFMESRFGADFSQVRIHMDSQAAQMNRELNARAFTVDKDIYFNEGQYQANSIEGRKLLAHELTHVIQQNNGPEKIQRTAIHSGSILFEGTCEHLACNSRWACEDDTNGVLCPTGTRNAGTRRRPLFTCDTRCENNRTCDDSGNWMAIPSSRFARSKCGQDLVICANNRFTHATVRDRSVGEHWEVSPGIIDALGLPRGTFTGSIYGDETDADFLTDGRCRAAASSTSSSTSSASASGVIKGMGAAVSGAIKGIGAAVSRVWSSLF
ncbi:MAG: DUF4157 domain-containing protein [Lewinellaceae bacterium]|nr:DUF4157 domain-containing protein [Lewinellaceae bacterium]